MNIRNLQSLVEARDDQFVRHAYEAADLEAAVDNRAEQLAEEMLNDLTQIRRVWEILPPDQPIDCQGVPMTPIEILLLIARNHEVLTRMGWLHDAVVQAIAADEQVRAQALADTIGDLEDRFYSER